MLSSLCLFDLFVFLPLVFNVSHNSRNCNQIFLKIHSQLYCLEVRTSMLRGHHLEERLQNLQNPRSKA